MVDQARPNRAEEVRRDRRMKPGSIEHMPLKLAVDEKHLDRNQFEYRWVNDKGNRVQQMTARDWDVAPEQAAMASDGAGTVQSKVAGTEEGKPFNTVLMRKYKDWYRDDQQTKQAALDAVENTIRRGTVHQEESPELRGGVGYTPNKTNRIDRS